jgi:two-component system sensor histidine kinase/response regulator
MRDTPVLEISRLQEIFEDDAAGIADLLEAAMNTGAGHQAALRGALTRGALQDVMRAAHAIKGSTANIGGNEVADVAGRIEATARDQRWDGIEAALSELDAAYDRLRAAVAEYRAEVQ